MLQIELLSHLETERTCTIFPSQKANLPRDVDQTFSPRAQELRRFIIQ